MKKINIFNVFLASAGLAVLGVSSIAYGHERAREVGTNAVYFKDDSKKIKGYKHTGMPVDDGGGDSFTGVAWLDFNNDGWLDMYIANGLGSSDGLMMNNGDGTFTNVIVAAGIGGENGSSGVVAADLDNDGLTDIVAVGETGLMGMPSSANVRVFKNRGGGKFSDVTATTGLLSPSLTNEPGTAMHATLGDIDNDGFLDLFIVAPGSLAHRTQPANTLWRNNGDFTFTNISSASGVDIATGSCVATFSHYDNDAWIDLYVADCNDINLAPTDLHVFKNNGDLSFEDLTTKVGLDTSKTSEPSATGRGYWMCIGLGDFDNDSDFDLFSTNFGLQLVPNQEVGFFERNTNGTFTSVETEVGIGEQAIHFGWGCGFADFNNDGFEDVIHAGNLPAFGLINEQGGPGYLFVNQGNKQFSRNQLPVDLRSKYVTGLATADYNNDGFTDVVMSAGAWDGEVSSLPILLTNKHYKNRNRSITVKLEGVESNRSAIGAIVNVYLPGRILTKEVRAGSSFLSQHSPWLTFGVATAKKIKKIAVRWPNGNEEVYRNIRVKRTAIMIKEGKGIVH